MSGSTRVRCRSPSKLNFFAMCVLELCKENHAHSEWKSGPELKHGLTAWGKGNIYSKEVLAWKGFA